MPGGFLKGLLNGKLIEGAKQIIDEVVTTKEEKAQLEIRLKELITTHEQAIIKAENDDRSSARMREVEALRTGARNWTQNVLAFVGVICFFGFTAYMVAYGLGEMNTEASFIVGNVCGIAAAIAKDIYGYYFGSSKGEHDKAMAPLFKERR